MRGPDKRKRAVYRPSRRRTKYWRGPEDGRTIRGQPPHRLPTKLTAHDVAWIKGAIRLAYRRTKEPGRRRYVPQGLYQRLADKFGVTERTILSIRKRERWRSVRAMRWDTTLEPKNSGRVAP